MDNPNGELDLCKRLEDHVEGPTVRPSKTTSNGETNPEFILWQRFD